MSTPTPPPDAPAALEGAGTLTTTAGPGRPGVARERYNLIEQIAAEAVVSDYAGAPATAEAGSRRQRVVVAAAALGLAGFVLALGISARILNTPAVNDQRAALIERINEADGRQDDLTTELEALRQEVVSARQDNLEQTLAGRVLTSQIADLELVTGYSAVTGPGVEVTLTDAPRGDQVSSQDVERVIDADVQRAVNGLWRAGAEAVAINGQRLTARTAIRSAAGAILVNYRPLSPPYRIQAIGDPDTLSEEFLASPDAAALRKVSEQFGIGFDTKTSRGLDLPASTSRLPDTATVVGTEEGEGR